VVYGVGHWGGLPYGSSAAAQTRPFVVPYTIDADTNGKTAPHAGVYQGWKESGEGKSARAVDSR